MFLRRFVCSAFILLLSCPSVSQAAPRNADANDSYTLFSAGDLMLARWMHRSVDDSVENVFGDLLPIMRRADLTFVNLESVLSDKGQVVEKGESRPFPYRGRPTLVRLLAEAGIDIVCQANNHAGDYGPQALIDSMNILRSVGIAAPGVGVDDIRSKDIHYMNVGAIKTAWIAFQTQEPIFAAGPGLAGTFYCPENEIETTVTPLIRDAKTYADIVFVTAHWGPNWADKPSVDRRAMAKKMIDAGADAVLGHSSHVYQGAEIYKNKPILYDMGSFLFDSTSDTRLRDSMYFILTLDNRGVCKVEAVPIRLSNRRVRLAQNSFSRIAQTFTQRSHYLNPTAKWRSDTKKVWLNLLPLKARDSKLENHNFFMPEQTEQELIRLKSRVPSTVGESIDEPTDQPMNLIFSNGVRVHSVQLPKYVPQSNSFFTDIIFSTDRIILKPGLEIMILLYSNALKSNMPVAVYSHGPGDWIFPAELWPIGSKIRDYSLFRPPADLPIGNYRVTLKMGYPGQRGWELLKLMGSNQTEATIGQLSIIAKNDQPPAGLKKYN